MSTPQKIPRVNFPAILAPIFEPKRYKVLYGGRGSAKSWSVARAFLIKGRQQRLRILCVRELQKSIKDSVHRLLKDQIEELGLQSFYVVTDASIKGLNGTEFFFEGLRHNALQIKSYEGADIVWVEEAAIVSKSSWDVLTPTIRKDDSEIWITFNPELDDDETYQRYVVSPPENALVIKINHRDNPWFPEVLKQEMLDLKARDFDSYLNVWEGHCKETLDGAIYAKEIREAKLEDRITRVPYDPSVPVHCGWDLGRSDNTSIWFFQRVGFEYHVIDFYQNSGEWLQHYLKVLSEKPYVYGTQFLPHDGNHKMLVADKSVRQLVEDFGYTTAIVARAQNAAVVANDINICRTIFKTCWFDQEKTADGLQSLRRYRYDKNADTGRISKAPLHDINSHAADGFRSFAVGFKEESRTTLDPTPSGKSCFG